MSEASGIPSWCRVGQRVVCIAPDLPDGVWNDNTTGERIQGPTTNSINIIIGVALVHGHVCLALKGFPVPAAEGFSANYFRPLVPTKTEAEDVALFRDALTQRTPEPVA